MVAPPPYYPQLRTATEGPPNRNDGSRTITIAPDPEGDDSGDSNDRGEGPSGVLRLRGGPGPRDEERTRVTWEEGTVDNEFLGRKKSKICCIFHKSKPKNLEDPFQDSSSSSGSSDNDSDSDSDEGSSASAGESHVDRPESALPETRERSSSSAHGKENKDNKKKKQKKHRHGADCQHAHDKPPANAYEHQPKYGKFKKSKSKPRGSSTKTVVEEA